MKYTMYIEMELPVEAGSDDEAISKMRALILARSIRSLPARVRVRVASKVLLEDGGAPDGKFVFEHRLQKKPTLSESIGPDAKTLWGIIEEMRAHNSGDYLDQWIETLEELAKRGDLNLADIVKYDARAGVAIGPLFSILGKQQKSVTSTFANESSGGYVPDSRD